MSAVNEAGEFLDTSRRMRLKGPRQPTLIGSADSWTENVTRSFRFKGNLLFKNIGIRILSENSVQRERFSDFRHRPFAVFGKESQALTPYDFVVFRDP